MKNSAIILSLIFLCAAFKAYSQHASFIKDSTPFSLTSNISTENSDVIMNGPLLKQSTFENNLSEFSLERRTYGNFTPSMRLQAKESVGSLASGKRLVMFSIIKYDFGSRNISLISGHDIKTAPIDTRLLRASIDAAKNFERYNNISFSLFTLTF